MVDPILEIIAGYSGNDVINKFAENKMIVIFGAGGAGKHLLEVMENIGVKVKYFFDNDEKKWGKFIDGIKILPPSKLIDFECQNMLICIASNWAQDVASQLKQMGIKNFIDLTYWDKRWEKHYGSQPILDNLEEIKKVYSLLEDNESKNTLLSIIKFRLTLDPTHLCKAPFKQYCHPKVHYEVGDIVIDAGAWIGDTAIEIAELLNNKCNIFSFEPDESNYELLLENISKNKYDKVVTPVKFGLWDRKTDLYLDKKSGTNSQQYRVANDGDEKIKLVSLDCFAKEAKIIPNIIKMDIEGSEIMAIKGTKEILSNYQPRLQICLYHEVDDLWKIPLLLKDINPRYKFYLAHHTQNLPETVLYAAVSDSM